MQMRKVYTLILHKYEVPSTVLGKITESHSHYSVINSARSGSRALENSFDQKVRKCHSSISKGVSIFRSPKPNPSAVIDRRGSVESIGVEKEARGRRSGPDSRAPLPYRERRRRKHAVGQPVRYLL